MASLLSSFHTKVASPSSYFFSDVYWNPEVQELAQQSKDEEILKVIRTVELFSYGVYRHYIGNEELLLPLGPLEQRKLRQLTLISLCSNISSIKYDYLLKGLYLSSIYDLESIILDTIYSGLLQATLYSDIQELHISFVKSRDVLSKNNHIFHFLPNDNSNNIITINYLKTSLEKWRNEKLRGTITRLQNSLLELNKSSISEESSSASSLIENNNSKSILRTRTISKEFEEKDKIIGKRNSKNRKFRRTQENTTISKSYLRTGLYQSTKPYILGLETTGVIVTIESQITNYKIGDNVAYFSASNFAQYTVVSAGNGKISKPSHDLDEGGFLKFMVMF